VVTLFYLFIYIYLYLYRQVFSAVVLFLVTQAAVGRPFHFALCFWLD